MFGPLSAVVAATPSGPGSTIDDRDVEGARSGRAALIALPAVVVLLPHEAGAHAEVGQHRALDEDRRFVGVRVLQVRVDGRAGRAADALDERRPLAAPGTRGRRCRSVQFQSAY